MALFRGLGARKDATRGTTPIEVRKVLAGLFSPVGGINTRSGILLGADSPLVTGDATWAYNVGLFHAYVTRSASDGGQVYGNDGSVLIGATGVGSTVPIAPASGLQRIDIIWTRHQTNGENTDTASDPLFGVASGTAAAVAVAPSIPTGAIELARNLMTSAATSTVSSGNTITQSALYTALRGAPIPVRNQTERDALTLYDGLGVYRLDLHQRENYNGTVWAVVLDPLQVRLLATDYSAGKNKALNGDISIWQRGTSFTGAGYCADRWHGVIVGTATISQETTVVPANSKYALKWVTGAASSYAQIRQYLENSEVIKLRGRTITVQAKVQCSASFAGNLVFESYYSTASDTVVSFAGVALMPANPTGQVVSSGYTLITAQITVPANAVGLYVGVVPTNAQATGQTAYIGEIQLEIGSVATAFQTATGNPASELAACMRRCILLTAADSGGVNQGFGVGDAWTTTRFGIDIPLPVKMAAIPSQSVSAFGQWAIYTLNAAKPITAISSNSPSKTMASLYVDAAAASFTAGAGGRLIANSNNTAQILLEAEL